MLSNSLSISWKEILWGGGSNLSTSRDLGTTAGGRYSKEDDACKLNGVEKLDDCTEACGGHWGSLQQGLLDIGHRVKKPVQFSLLSGERALEPLQDGFHQTEFCSDSTFVALG